jgi:hypothetical protein
MRNTLALAAAVTLAAAGCGYSTPEPKEPEPSGQTYAEALRVMCDVDELGGISSDDPFEAARKRTEIIQAKVENGDAIYLRTMLSVKGAAEQATELRSEAKEAGIGQCALADDLEKTGAGGIAP